MFIGLLLSYNLFLVWKQFNLRFSVYNSCYLFEYSADIIMFVAITSCSCALGPAAWCSGRLSSRQFTLNLVKVLAKWSSKTKDHTMVD